MSDTPELPLFNQGRSEFKMEALLRRERAPVNKYEEAFREWHLTHPGIYLLFDRFTRKMLERGYDHGAAKMVGQFIRWETSATDYEDTVIGTGEPVKISDSHCSYYSRLWMDRNPEHAGFFRTKRLKPGRD